MDKITFWQFLEHIRNSGFKENNYFDISRKDKRRIKTTNYCVQFSCFAIIVLIPLFDQDKMLLCLTAALGAIMELLLSHLAYYKIYKNADIVVINRHTEKIASKISFWRYFKYTRSLGLTENNVFDISSKDKKRIFIVNLGGIIFIVAFVIFAVLMLESIDIIIYYGILILAVIIVQLITLPFHYKIYKNIEITEYNKYADDSIFN